MTAGEDDRENGEPSSPVCYAGQVNPAYSWRAGEGPDIRVKRVHDPVEPGDGQRILVDRLWPRGLRKAEAGVDLWLREVAPSRTLRKWFHHDPARWDDFAARYRGELAEGAEALQPLLDAVRAGPVTLLFAARDRRHNHAVVLRDVLRERLAENG